MHKHLIFHTSSLKINYALHTISNDISLILRSAQIVCQKKRICANTIACYNYCLRSGFKEYGRCDVNGLCYGKKG